MRKKTLEIKFFLYALPGYYIACYCKPVSRTNGLVWRIEVVFFLKQKNQLKLHILLHRANIHVPEYSS